MKEILVCYLARVRLIEHCVEQDKENAGQVKGEEIVLVLGPTGAGKSTLLNYMAGCQMIEEADGLVKRIKVEPA